jgi:SAM-dependent methyltransferase
VNRRPAGPPEPSPAELQRQYYAATARHYDRSHVQEGDEHYFALAFLRGALDFLKAESVLEIGAGTGRALAYLKERAPHVTRMGVEPVAELRAIAFEKGISRDELVEGNGLNLPFADGSYDVTCAFGVLHHVRDHRRVVAEMLRVARKAIFISDGNNFGHGRLLVRTIKHALHAVGAWKLANFIKTRGKGYQITSGDGLAYSYSVFSDYEFIRSQCKSTHMLNTSGSGVNPYRSATHVALLGIR